MKQTTRTVVVLIVILVCGIILSGCNKVLHGVWTNGSTASVDVVQKCFFIEPNTWEIRGESTFFVSGNLDENGTFDGTMNVEKYPIPEEIIEGNISGEIRGEYLILSCQIIGLLDTGIDTYYNVFIDYNDTSIIIYIYNNGDVITAICADSEEAALENFRAYVSKSSG